MEHFHFACRGEPPYSLKAWDPQRPYRNCRFEAPQPAPALLLCGRKEKPTPNPSQEGKEEPNPSQEEKKESCYKYECSSQGRDEGACQGIRKRWAEIVWTEANKTRVFITCPPYDLSKITMDTFIDMLPETIAQIYLLDGEPKRNEVSEFCNQKPRF